MHLGQKLATESLSNGYTPDKMGDIWGVVAETGLQEHWSSGGETDAGGKNYSSPASPRRDPGYF